MDRILSVIVPAYNVEKYLRECLDSLIIREEPDRMEVLIIDDGSTDSSREIGLSYEKRFPDIFRVISKKNGGHGSALNRGIAEADGKYIKVVDGDDWLDTEELKKMVDFLETADQDMIAANYCWVDTYSRKKTVQQEAPFEGVIYGKTYTMDEIGDRTYIKMHSVIIKTEVMRKVPCPIDEHCFYVDSEYVMFPIPFTQKVVFLDSYLYMYRIGRKNQSVNSAQMAKNKSQHLKVFYRLLEYYRWAKTQKGTTRGQIQYLEHGISLIFKSQYKVYLCCPYSGKLKQELIAFDKKIMDEYPEIYKRTDSRAVKIIRMFRFGMFRPSCVAFKCISRILKK